jgi:hypothetical protein
MHGNRLANQEMEYSMNACVKVEDSTGTQFVAAKGKRRTIDFRKWLNMLITTDLVIFSKSSKLSRG